MKLKLFFKQSLKDFVIHWPLYLTFTLFLILSLSMSLGLVSFTSLFINDMNHAIGLKPMDNVEFKLEKYYVDQRQTKNDDESIFQKEHADEPLFKFFEETIKDVKTTEQQKWNRMIYRHFALNYGDIIHIDPVANLTTMENNNLEQPDYDQINQYIDQIRLKFKMKYHVTNIQMAFFVNEYLKQINHDETTLMKEKFYFRKDRDNSFQVKLENQQKSGFLKTLLTNPEMGDLHQGYYGDEIANKLFDQQPETQKIANYNLFHANDLNKTYFDQTINFNDVKYQNYLDKSKPEFGRFFYVSPKDAHFFDLKIGQEYNIHLMSNENIQSTNRFLFAGVLINGHLWHDPFWLDLFIPLQTINKLMFETHEETIDQTDSTPLDRYWDSAQRFTTQIKMQFWFPNQGDAYQAQNFFSNWFEKNLMTSWGDYEAKLQSNTDWIERELYFNTLSILKIFILLTVVISLFGSVKNFV
ncbi:hypothetical protein [Williamsoniiplasma lucivorax]|uniref:Uncharacterized protein n=2 Tax=Williamsoniiplasma lucivorax TaxID=209274 RepID=A0A2S5RFH0_9MOLU|nr:hypothetical protein [Williamsoniiplasma lucivorax]PPE06047.1 hypothetical protein ELUCI_v1c03380 [Williamsoniiplasma lucivorax]